MRIASQILIFGQEKWVQKYLENTSPYVEKIYVSYSKEPWIYNPNARGRFYNTFEIDSLKNDSRYKDKLVFIEGVWNTEEDQRNACLNAAKQDGFNYIFVHDTDEFFTEFDWKLMLDMIEKNPNYDYYSAQSRTFWKSFKYVILNMHGGLDTGEAPIVMNLNRNNSFERKRGPRNKSYISLGVLFYHGSYVLNDQEMHVKLQTWGHASDFNTGLWYQDIWLNWTLDSINLHPLMPEAWSRVVNYNGILPEVLTDMR